MNVGPVFIAIQAGVVLREGFPRTLFTGCAVAFGGVALIGIATSRHGIDSATGALLCIAAAAACALAVVVQKPLLERSSGLSITFLACAVAAVACLPFAPQLAGTGDAGALAWVVYLGLFPTAIGFSTWAYALKHTSAGRMGAFTYHVPPVAVLLGWIVLSETPRRWHWAAGCSACSGSG